MTAYEIATVVHDAHIDVDPSLEGQRVRVIILAPDAEPAVERTTEMTPPSPRFGKVSIPGVRITFLTRDKAHVR